MSKKAKTTKNAAGKDADPGVMTRQDKLMETWANKLAEQFNDKFARFEEALTLMAERNPAPQTQQQETRLVNENVIPTPNQANKQTSGHVQLLQETPDVTLMETEARKRPATFLPPQLRSEPKTPDVTCFAAASAPSVNNNIGTWVFNEAAQIANPQPVRHLPSSAAAFMDNDALDKTVQKLLETTAHQLSSGTAIQGFYPHKYVRRGPEKKRATLNSLSLTEYTWGLCRMMKDDKVPAEIKPYIFNHLEEILDDAEYYDWASGVRRWSEEVFSQLAEGRIPGWHAQSQIQMLRVTLSKVHSNKQTQYRDTPYSSARSKPATATASEVFKGGPPCQAYNTQNGCNLPSGHFVNGKRVMHVCTYCLFNTSAAHTHPETECRNRVRFQPHF